MRNRYPTLFILLAKRLLKKKTFVILLLMIPLTVLLTALISEGDSGMVRIALVDEGGEKGKGSADELISKLMSKESVFLFKKCRDKSEALRLLDEDEADQAWIFSKDYRRRIDGFTMALIQDEDDPDPAVEVILREDNVLTQLSRLELFGMMYSDLSFSLFEKYIDEVLGDDPASKDELRCFYDSDNGYGKLFVYRGLKGLDDEGTDGYLFAPVRGLLLILVLICGLAASMYYRDDLDKGIFLWMPVGNRWVFEHIYLMTALIYGGLVVFVTFLVTGIVHDAGKELLLMLLFLLSSCCFCSLVRKITRNLRSLATSIPILILLFVAACPVFVYIRELKAIQLLLPPFYYLMALNNTGYVKYFVTYLILIIAVDVLTGTGSRCSG